MGNSMDQNIGRLLAMAEEHGKQLGRLFKKIDDLPEKCSTGVHNKDAVETLTVRVSKTESILRRVIIIGSITLAGGGGAYSLPKLIHWLLK